MPTNGKFRPLMSMLLALCLCGAALFSCGEAAAVTTDADTTASPAVTAAETTAAPTNDELFRAYAAALPDEDYGGYEFKIACRVPENNANWYAQDVFSEGINGEPINDAVYERNRTLEEQFNIKLPTFTGSKSAVETVKGAVLAGDDEYSLVSDGFNVLCTLATSGLLTDYHMIPAIDSTGEWWDQNMVNDCSIAGKLYFMTGDISIMDNQGTWCVLFVKGLVDSYSLKNPYKLVEDGTWTLDEMTAMARAVSRDIDGDGTMTAENDAFGLITEGFNTYGFWASAGERIITKDKNDLPTLTIYNERAASVIEKVLDLQLDPSSLNNTASIYYTVLSEQRAMFRFGGMMTIYKGRSLIDTDFGVIPAPKFDETQDKYYTTYSYGNLTAYSVPVTSSDLERTGTIIEAMAQLSRYSLTPAYYDTTLMGKAIRDDESEGMIALILANRNYDLGSTFNWGSTFSIFGSMFTAKTYDFASRCASAEDAANTAIGSFIESLG